MHRDDPKVTRFKKNIRSAMGRISGQRECKRPILAAEQGYGDTIQFARFT